MRTARTTSPSLMIHKLKDASRTTDCFLSRNCIHTVCNTYFFMKDARLTGMQFNWFRIYEGKEKNLKPVCFPMNQNLLDQMLKLTKTLWKNLRLGGFSRNWVVEIGLKKYIHSNFLFINTCQFIAFTAESPPASSPEWEILMQAGVTTDFPKLMVFWNKDTVLTCYTNFWCCFSTWWIRNSYYLELAISIRAGFQRM